MGHAALDRCPDLLLGVRPLFSARQPVGRSGRRGERSLGLAVAKAVRFRTELDALSHSSALRVGGFRAIDTEPRSTGRPLHGGGEANLRIKAAGDRRGAWDSRGQSRSRTKVVSGRKGAVRVGL